MRTRIRNCLWRLATDASSGVAPACARGVLLAVSFLYGLAVQLAAFFYGARPYRPACRLISIGNLTLGGTGKTVAVEYVARYIKEVCNRRVAIVSRGYKRQPGSPAARMGDEPFMLQQNLPGIPVLVDPDRVRGIRRAVSAHGAEAVVLDDGFQQWRLKKDLEIVAVDAANPFGNLHLLPRGTLREPLASLKRADLVLLTKTDLHPDIVDTVKTVREFNPGCLIVASRHAPLYFYRFGDPRSRFAADAFAGTRVAALCAIGDPGAFERTLEALRITVGASFTFTDHHQYTAAEIRGMISRAQQNRIDTVVTTEKDAVRLAPVLGAEAGAPLRFLVLRIGLEVTDHEQEFNSRLRGLFPV